MITIIENRNNTWFKEDALNVVIKVFFFLLSPFLSFIYSLKRINTKSSFVVFFLFALIYGLCFTVISDNSDVLETNDAAKWRFRFENTNLYTFSDYIEYCKEYFQFAGLDIRDLYFATVTYFVHLVSDNYHVFFLVVAVVYSYFQLRSFRYLVKSPAFDNSIECLMICMLFSIPTIGCISVFRFWTAAWMCVYGVFQIYYSGRKKYILLLLLLPLIHRAFFFLYFILLLNLTYRYNKWWKYIYFFSIIFSGLSVSIVRDATGYMPSFLTGMIDSYTEESTAELYSPTKFFLTNIAVIYINLLFVLIMIKERKNMKTELSNVFNFTLVYLSIVNFVMTIPSLGVRFSVLSYSFIAFLWLNTMGTKNNYSFLIYLMPLFMVRAVYGAFHVFTKFQDPQFYYTNPIELVYLYLTVK